MLEEMLRDATLFALKGKLGNHFLAISSSRHPIVKSWEEMDIDTCIDVALTLACRAEMCLIG